MSDQSTEGMYRFLLRWVGDGGKEYYYSGGYQSGTERSGQGDLIGVCLTPKGERPSGASSVGAFKSQVEDVALDVRWFEEPLSHS